MQPQRFTPVSRIVRAKQAPPTGKTELPFVRFVACKLIQVVHEYKHCMLRRFTRTSEETANAVKLTSIFVIVGRK